MTVYCDTLELEWVFADDLEPETTDKRKRRARRFQLEAQMTPPNPSTFRWTCEGARRGRSLCAARPAAATDAMDPRESERRADWIAHARAAMRDGPVALTPYDSAAYIVDQRGTIEPIHIVYRLLRQLNATAAPEPAFVEAHAIANNRLTAFFDDDQRRLLLSALEHVQLFAADTLQYARGCRVCPTVAEVPTRYGSLPLPMVVYWLCRRDIADDAISPHPTAVFTLGTRCGLLECCTPEHRIHSFKAPPQKPAAPKRKRTATEALAVPVASPTAPVAQLPPAKLPFIDRLVDTQVQNASAELFRDFDFAGSKDKKSFFGFEGSESTAAAMFLVGSLFDATLRRFAIESQ